MTSPARPRVSLGLRPQLLLGVASVTLLAILTTGYIALWAAGDTLREDREAHASTIAAAVARATGTVLARRGAPQKVDPTLMRTLLRRFVETTSAIELSVIGLDRQEIASFPPRRPGDQDLPIVTTALAGGPAVINYRRSPLGSDKQLVAYAPIEDGGIILGAIRVVFDATPPTQAVLRRSGLVLLVLVLLDAALVLGLGYVVLTQLVVRPLRQLRQATDRVGAGQAPLPFVVTGAKEILELATAFEQMTHSLASQREQLIRSEKLASVGRLAAGIAHEIGNPLATILGYVDILRSEAEGKAAMPAPERIDALARVKTETQRIHRIIRDLLDYSRPSSEEVVTTDPLRGVRGALGLLSPQPRFREVTVVCIPAGETWPAVLALPNRLVQVFLNLLGNAADAMGGKGTIVVSCEPSGDRVVLAIRDEGPGVPKELQNKIFDPFFTTKEVGQGTGLGLSISRSIVESSGGTLELGAGAPGQGAVFLLSLPAARG